LFIGEVLFCEALKKKIKTDMLLLSI